MSFFYYAGDATPEARVPLRRNLTARFGQGPSRPGIFRKWPSSDVMSALTAGMISFTGAIQRTISSFDRFLHRALEALAASKLRRIERELKFHGVRYRNEPE